MNTFDNYFAVQSFLDIGETKICKFELIGFDNINLRTDKVNIIISEYSSSTLNVNINWEDDPLYLTNYKIFGLFGYYSTKFVGMQYDSDSNTLTITDSNFNEIKLSY